MVVVEQNHIPSHVTHCLPHLDAVGLEPVEDLVHSLLVAHPAYDPTDSSRQPRPAIEA